MKLKCLSFNKNRLKCKNTKTVKRRSAVQHNRMLAHNFVKNAEYFRSFRLYEHFCLLDIEYNVLVNKLFHNERLEKFKRHFRRKTALPQFKLRSYNDYRTSRVVNALTKKILAETSLLTLNHIGNRLKRSV